MKTGTTRHLQIAAGGAITIGVLCSGSAETRLPDARLIDSNLTSGRVSPMAAPVDEMGVLATPETFDYCGDPDLAVMTIALHLTVRNHTSRNMIVARHPGVHPPTIARSAELGSAGVFEVVPISDDTVTDSHTSFGAQPEPDAFVILAPAAAFVTGVKVAVFVRSSDRRGPETAVIEDTSHVMQVAIDWRVAFAGHSDGEVAEIARRWSKWGKLRTAASYTNWIPFVAPPIAARQLCRGATLSPDCGDQSVRCGGCCQARWRATMPSVAGARGDACCKGERGQAPPDC